MPLRNGGQKEASVPRPHSVSAVSVRVLDGLPRHRLQPLAEKASLGRILGTHGISMEVGHPGLENRVLQRLGGQTRSQHCTQGTT